MKIKLTCDQCSNEYEVHPSTVKWNDIRGRKNKFCSRVCRTSFYSGSNNVFWDGGLNTKARHAFIEKQRRAAKRTTGTHTQEQWENLKRLFNFTCPWCRREEPEITLTEDHIEPICAGGANTIDNIQPLCTACNRDKWMDFIDFRPQQELRTYQAADLL